MIHFSIKTFILYLLLALASLLPIAHLPAQKDPIPSEKSHSELAYEYTKELSSLCAQLVAINQPATNLNKSYVCTYASTTWGDWKNLRNRLVETDRIFHALYDLSLKFDALIEEHETTVEYVAKSAYINLTIMCIYYRAPDYIEFYKAKKENIALFFEADNSGIKQLIEETQVKWDAYNASIFRNFRIRLGELKALDPENLDAKLMEAIALYLNGDPNASRAALEGLGKIVDNQPLDKKRIKDKYALSIRSWLAYLALTSGNITEAQAELAKLKELVLSKHPYLNDWALNGHQAIFNIINKGHEWSNILVNLPVGEASTTFHQSNLECPDFKQPNCLDVTNTRTKIMLVPEVLFKKTKDVWDSIQIIDDKIAFKNLEYQINVQNKAKKLGVVYWTLGKVPKNQKRVQYLIHKQRYAAIEKVLIRLIELRSAWQELVGKNPDIAIYRVYKIKTELAFQYLLQNRDGIMEFFKNYKPSNRPPKQAEQIANLSGNFDGNHRANIEADLEYLVRRNPGHISTIFIQAEVSAYLDTPEEAIKKITAFKAALPEAATCYNMNGGDLMKYYLAIANYRKGKSGYAAMVKEVVELGKQAILMPQLSSMGKINNLQYQIENH